MASESTRSNDVTHAPVRRLNRQVVLSGEVAVGDQRGRTLGFPTANLVMHDDPRRPQDGVYAGWYVRPDDSWHQAAVSIGRRPTFYGGHGVHLVEAHLLDFDENLYEEKAIIKLDWWVRAQRRFSSTAELVSQLIVDVAMVRAALGDRHPHEPPPGRADLVSVHGLSRSSAGFR